MLEFGNETFLSKKNQIPKEAFLYFPSEEEVIQYNKNDPSKSIRRIFEGGVKYYEFEEQSISNFNQELLKREIILPSNWLHCDTLRFLQATSHDYTRTILLILDHLEWKKNRVTIVPSDKITEILNSGFLYVHGRDNRYRPIMVLDPFIFHKLNKKYSTQEWVLSMIYLFEYIKLNCFLPGQIENWNIICDVAKVNILFIPPEFKEILTSLQSNYRCRLYVMLIINVSLLIKSLWNIIKNILDKTTERKIRLINVDQNVDIEVFSFINRSQVEKKFGGDAENIENTFFPPTFPSNDYFTDYDNPKEILVSEEVYKKKIQDNCLLIPSPFIDQTNLNNVKNDLIPSIENEKKIEKNTHNTEISIYEDVKSFESFNQIPKLDENAFSDNIYKKEEIHERSFNKEEFKSIEEGKTEKYHKEEDLKEEVVFNKEPVNVEECTVLENTINSKIVNYSELVGFGESIQTKKSYPFLERTNNNGNDVVNFMSNNEINDFVLTKTSKNNEELYKSNQIERNFCINNLENDNAFYDKSYNEHKENKIQVETFAENENKENCVNNEEAKVDENYNRKYDKPRSIIKSKDIIKEENRINTEEGQRKCLDTFSNFNSVNCKSSINTNNLETKTNRDLEIKEREETMISELRNPNKDSTNFDLNNLSSLEFKSKQNILNKNEALESNLSNNQGKQTINGKRMKKINPRIQTPQSNSHKAKKRSDDLASEIKKLVRVKEKQEEMLNPIENNEVTINEKMEIKRELVEPTFEKENTKGSCCGRITRSQSNSNCLII